MLTKDALARELQTAGRTIAERARARHNERQALRRDPMIPPSGLGAVLSQHRAAEAAERRTMLERAGARVAEFRAESAKRTPDFRPAGAAQASWLAAQASLIPSYSPRQLSSAMQEAVANGDHALLSLLVPYAASVHEYKKGFADSGAVSNALIDARLALESVPEVVAARDAQSFADAAEQELKTLDNILGADNAMAALDAYGTTNALPLVLPAEIATTA